MLPLKSDPLAFAAELRPQTASIVVDPNTIQRPQPASFRRQRVERADIDLRSASRLVAAASATRRPLAELSRAGRGIAGLRARHGLHPHRIPAGQRASVRRIVGLSADRPVCSDQSLRHSGRLCRLDRCMPPRRTRPSFSIGCRDTSPTIRTGSAISTARRFMSMTIRMQGRHLDWNTLVYNYGRTEVANFLLASGLFWLDRYRIDGLRVDAVASMLYLDYSRPEGGWIPNKYGGRENLEAISLLRRFNSEVFSRFPNATTAAEESTAWPMVSRPVDWGGLGFGYKWNMGWMHDTLEYIGKDPIYRKHHHGQILFGLHYAFFENFILPLSHDEVVHGKRSILGRMPGDEWQRFANLRAYYGFMFGHPGKKLLFMGEEFGQENEWRHDHSLDWHLLEHPRHAGVQALIRDLNRLYRTCRHCTSSIARTPDSSGWSRMTPSAASSPGCAKDARRTSAAWWWSTSPPRSIAITGSRFHFPESGARFSTPIPPLYGGSNVGNGGAVRTLDEGTIPEVSLVVPPLAAIFLVPER